MGSISEDGLSRFGLHLDCTLKIKHPAENDLEDILDVGGVSRRAEDARGAHGMGKTKRMLCDSFLIVR